MGQEQAAGPVPRTTPTGEAPAALQKEVVSKECIMAKAKGDIKTTTGRITASANVQVKEECTDVLHDLLKRFGDNRVWWSEQESMVNSLMQLLYP